MAKPRPASFGQLINLNGLGALKLVAPGGDEPVDFASAWTTLEEAERAGVWTPRHARANEAA